MNKTLTTLLTLTVVAALPLYVCADEGKTPIYEPNTTIDQAGSYVVTRDITAAIGNGTAITIAADDVTIDLNGYTVKNLDDTAPVVDASGFFDIFLTNGTLDGGSIGFLADNVASGRKARVRLENLTVKGAAGNGIEVAAAAIGSNMSIKAATVSNAGGNGVAANVGGGSVDIADNTIEDITGGDGIALTGTGPIYVGDNTLRDIANTGVRITGAQGTVIEDNQIFNIGIGGGDGEAAIDIVGTGIPEWGNQIRGNTLSGSALGGANSVGIKIGLGVNGNILSENTVTQFANGIVVASNSNTIRGNNVATSLEVGDAVNVTGMNNIIRENQCLSQAGIGVNSADLSNFVLSNMLEGNTGAVAGPSSDGGVGNFDNP